MFSDAGLKDTRTFLIAALPVSLGYDGSDNLLDPTRGFRLSGRLSPELSLHGGHFTYARSQIDVSAYHPVSDRVVVAGRVRLGTIFGAGVYDIAPSRRFYSGGGGSVRGYGYQQARAQGHGRRPRRRPRPCRIRARSAHPPEAVRRQFRRRAVLRWRDAQHRTMAGFQGGWRFAAGLGVRYYSSFGPIRIDLGVPLNRQKGDGPVAVTVSLGQAF